MEGDAACAEIGWAIRCESGVSAADMCIMSALRIATIVDSTVATCTWTSMCVRERLRINIGVTICRFRRAAALVDECAA